MNFCVENKFLINGLCKMLWRFSIIIMWGNNELLYQCVGWVKAITIWSKKMKVFGNLIVSVHHVGENFFEVCGSLVFGSFVVGSYVVCHDYDYCTQNCFDYTS